MPKVSTVTIEKVQSAHRQMVQDEGKSSLRGVFERLGRSGSIAVVSELYDIVVSREREAERFRHKTLSQDLHVAVHLEIEHHVQVNIGSLSGELATLRESLRYLEDVLAQTNARMTALEVDLAKKVAEVEKRDHQAAELAKKYEIALGAKTELLARILSELNAVNQKYEEAERRAIEAVTRLDERQKIGDRKTNRRSNS